MFYTCFDHVTRFKFASTESDLSERRRIFMYIKLPRNVLYVSSRVTRRLILPGFVFLLWLIKKHGSRIFFVIIKMSGFKYWWFKNLINTHFYCKKKKHNVGYLRDNCHQRFWKNQPQAQIKGEGAKSGAHNLWELIVIFDWIVYWIQIELSNNKLFIMIIIFFFNVVIKVPQSKRAQIGNTLLKVCLFEILK